MTKDNEDALRCAEEYADAVADHRLESLYGTSKAYTLGKAKERDEAHAALKAAIGRLVAENEANERNLEQLTDELSGCVKLLRQAVEALERIDGWLKVRHMGGLMPDEKAIQEAINQHLEGKA